jgi:hypothetical protein
MRRGRVVRRPRRRTGSNWIPWFVIIALLVIGGIVAWVVYTNGQNDVPGVEGARAIAATLPLF